MNRSTLLSCLKLIRQCPSSDQTALAGWGGEFVGEVVTPSCPLVFGFRFRLEKVGNLTFVKKTVLQTRTYLFLEFFSAL